MLSSVEQAKVEHLHCLLQLSTALNPTNIDSEHLFSGHGKIV